MDMVNDEVFWNEKRGKQHWKKTTGFLYKTNIPYAMHIYYVPLKNSQKSYFFNQLLQRPIVLLLLSCHKVWPNKWKKSVFCSEQRFTCRDIAMINEEKGSEE